MSLPDLPPLLLSTLTPHPLPLLLHHLLAHLLTHPLNSYRIGERSFFSSLFENLKWLLLLAIFLGGLSLHVSQALLSHMFEINMTWGSTGKEAEFSNFFIEVPKVLKSFKYSLAFSVFGAVGMVVLATGSFVPYGWAITDFIAILPMATICVSHFLLPIALNPALMTFSW